jgi:hypothetical protein
MDDYDRKTAGMIGALLFALSMILIMCTMFQMEEYIHSHVPTSGNGVFALSILCLFLVIIGFVLLPQADKKQ